MPGGISLAVNDQISRNGGAQFHGTTSGRADKNGLVDVSSIGDEKILRRRIRPQPE